MMNEEQRQRNREACRRWYRKNKDKSKACHDDWVRRNWGRYAMREVRRRAKTKSLPVDIDAEWLNERLARGVCEATGIELVWEGPDRDNPWAPSVDRKDPSLGYTQSNVQVTCWAYNWAKGKWPTSVLERLARAILEKE